MGYRFRRSIRMRTRFSGGRTPRTSWRIFRAPIAITLESGSRTSRTTHTLVSEISRPAQSCPTSVRPSPLVSSTSSRTMITTDSGCSAPPPTAVTATVVPVPASTAQACPPARAYSHGGLRCECQRLSRQRSQSPQGRRSSSTRTTKASRESECLARGCHP